MSMFRYKSTARPRHAPRDILSNALDIKSICNSDLVVIASNFRSPGEWSRHGSLWLATILVESYQAAGALAAVWCMLGHHFFDKTRFLFIVSGQRQACLVTGEASGTTFVDQSLPRPILPLKLVKSCALSCTCSLSRS